MSPTSPPAMSCGFADTTMTPLAVTSGIGFRRRSIRSAPTTPAAASPIATRTAATRSWARRRATGSASVSRPSSVGSGPLLPRGLDLAEDPRLQACLRRGRQDPSKSGFELGVGEAHLVHASASIARSSALRAA